jgi:hypothetical protein
MPFSFSNNLLGIFVSILLTQYVSLLPILNENLTVDSILNFTNQSNICQTKECFNYGKIF